VQESGRIFAKLVGLYGRRHLITGVGCVLLLLVAAVLLARTYSKVGRDKALTIALAMLVVPSAWFVLSAISNHYLLMLWNEFWWDLLVVFALGVTVVCARTARQAA
jgi:hypothetical protein